MLPEEVTKFIGKADEVRIMEVEKGAIKKFADAVGDPNPFYWDEEYATNSRYGSIIAPPGFFGWPLNPEYWQPPATRGGERSGSRDELNATLAKAGFTRGFDGGVEYEFFKPIRAGDTLVAASKVKDITEAEGRTGTLAFVTSETIYINQHGDVVTRTLTTGIRVKPKG